MTNIETTTAEYIYGLLQQASISDSSDKMVELRENACGAYTLASLLTNEEKPALDLDWWSNISYEFNKIILKQYCEEIDGIKVDK